MKSSTSQTTPHSEAAQATSTSAAPTSQPASFTTNSSASAALTEQQSPTVTSAGPDTPPAPPQQPVDQVHQVPLDELKPNPENAKIYGEEPVDQDLVKSIGQHGMQEPLIATRSNVLVAGHRRLAAAKQAGKALVPVIYRDYANETEQLTALLESNLQRVKSNYVRGIEAELLMGIEEKLAKDRKKAGKKIVGKPPPTGTGGAEPTAPDKGTARDRVGEQIGSSGVTAGKLVAVVKEIRRLESNGEPEKASELLSKLNKSVDAAHKALTGKATPAPKANAAAADTKTEAKPTPSKVAAVHGLKTQEAAIKGLDDLIEYFEDLDVEKVEQGDADRLLDKVNELATTAKNTLVEE